MAGVLYKGLCRFGDKFVYPVLPGAAKQKWDHPAGPKTVFFWAPSIKWVLVAAGVSDWFRPPQKLSLYQNSALAATGAIWTRYSFVIVPKNYMLASVNILLFCVGFGSFLSYLTFINLTNSVQLMRIANYHYNESKIKVI